MGWSSSVSVWGQLCTDGSPLVLWLYRSERYSDDPFRKKIFEPDGYENYREVNNNFKKCEKNAKETWI